MTHSRDLTGSIFRSTKSAGQTRDQTVMNVPLLVHRQHRADAVSVLIAIPGEVLTPLPEMSRPQAAARTGGASRGGAGPLPGDAGAPRGDKCEFRIPATLRVRPHRKDSHHQVMLPGTPPA